MAKTNKKHKDPKRNALLAKVHIAKKDLGLLDDDYRDILSREFGVSSASKLNDRELGSLVDYFQSKGWRRQAPSAKRQAKGRTQTQALKEKAERVLAEAVDDGRVRYPRGLVRKVCGVDDVRFCKDAGRLKRLLAVLERIE